VVCGWGIVVWGGSDALAGFFRWALSRCVGSGLIRDMGGSVCSFAGGSVEICGTEV
jgi:hypothetical protein